MNNGQRPHSRPKSVGSGRASVGGGRRINTGSRPVGNGGRPSGVSFGSSGGGSSGGGGYRGFGFFGGGGGGKKFSLKSILIFALVVIVLLVVFTKCGGGLFSQNGGIGGFGDISQPSYTNSYEDDGDASYTSPDYSVSPLAREKYFSCEDSDGTVTVMIYMCGTDLESKYGMATKDIKEMLAAKLSEKINIVIETGGCSDWKNDAFSSSVNQIYNIGKDGLTRLSDNFGTLAMTDPKNLTKFINFCKDKYKNSRKILILWDHGGGSVSGYGYDEKNPGSSSMTLAKIDAALSAANCKFDVIGFDACLMATLETALVCDGYADYLIASEETEPGTGWYYTNFLTELAKDPTMSTVKLSQIIVDDFVSASRGESPSAKVTLSAVDLSELHSVVPSALTDFAQSTNEMIRANDYASVSAARAGARQFSEKNKLNQVDLADLASRIGTADAKELASAVKGSVKYNRSTISRANGLSIYFPYETTKTVSSAIASYDAIGFPDEYAKCIKSFASLELGGQVAAAASQTNGYGTGGTDILGALLGSVAQGSSTSPVDALLGSFIQGGSSAAGYGMDAGSVLSLLSGFSGLSAREIPSGYEWIDKELIADNAESIAQNFIDPSHIVASQKGGKRVLELGEDEWQLIEKVQLSLYAEDGDGYLDLGLDNVAEYTEDGDLILDWDGSWLTVGGNVCAYYLVSDTENADGSWTTIGRIPAILNEKLVNLRVVFDKKHPEGVITGAYPLFDDSLGVEAKGDIPVQKGDTLEFICDRYSADGSYENSYSLGAAFTVSQTLKIENLMLDGAGFSPMYMLTDIYGNDFWVK